MNHAEWAEGLEWAELMDMVDMFYDFPRMAMKSPDEAAAVHAEQSRRVDVRRAAMLR